MCVMPSAAGHTDLALASADAFAAWRGALLEAGFLVDMGVRGLYGRGREFERIVEGFEAYTTRMAAPLGNEVLRFPPIFARSHYARIDHIKNFPDLMGSVHTFVGGDREHLAMLDKFGRGEDWSRDLDASEVMLTPAICYPLYPTAAGTLPPGGRRVDLLGYAFRHEPSDDPARMQLFRQREFVRLGSPDEALEHRDSWLARGEEMLRNVGLAVRREVANDPFFGRGGKLLKATQREQDLKYEIVVTVPPVARPCAIASSNYHLDHFGEAFGIRTADGAVAHSACIGFGLERIALALLGTHGLDLKEWPAEVRHVLALD